MVLNIDEPKSFVPGAARAKVGMALSAGLKLTITALLVLGLTACGARSGGRQQTTKTEKGYYQEGEASWYGPGFNGRKTANGEKYNMNDMTAAHRNLPFDTWAVVKNMDNGQEVVVRINDRGPFHRGRIIDLSKAAAEEIDLAGVGQVSVQTVTEAEARQLMREQSIN